MLDLIQDPEVEVLVLVYGRRAGKTKICSHLAAGSVVTPDDGGVIWSVAPTYQLARMVYREAEFTLRRSFKPMLIEDRSADMVMKTLWHPDMKGHVKPSELWAKSADSEVSLLGEGLRLAILDEAARMKAEVWNEYISPALEERHGKAVIITTPKGKGHWTYPMWKAGRNSDNTGPATSGPIRSLRFPSWINPLIDRSRIESRLKTGHMTLKSYQENYCAEFLDDGGSVFHDVRSRALLDPTEPEPGMRYSLGCDLARYSDYTVLTVMNRRKEVCYVERLPHVEWHLQELKMLEIARRYNRASIVIDASGVGDPIAETLIRKSGGIPVTPFKYNGTSKSELVDHLVILFERQEISLLKAEHCPVMLEELEAFEYILTKARRLRMEAPSGQHDDCVNSLALAAWYWKATDPKPMSMIQHRIERPSYAGGRSSATISVQGETIPVIQRGKDLWQRR